MKQPYVRPQLAELGSVQDLTLANTTGNLTDQTFPRGTDPNSITFS